MITAVHLAWSQLRHERTRVVVAIAGVGFAVVLMFMQVGFMDALFGSAVELHHRLNADIVLIHPHYDVLGKPTAFPRRRLYQALAVDGVAGVTGLYTSLARWKNPWTGRTRDLFLIGVDPAAHPLSIAAVETQRRLLRHPDMVLFDALAREEFGPVAAAMTIRHELVAELNGRRVTVGGVFELGTTIGTDATVITSQSTFRHLLPAYGSARFGIGLVRLRSGIDAEATRLALAERLPPDVTVLTTDEFVARELRYWRTVSPIGFIFTFGVAMGILVGAIIVYQILFADLADHELEYATLKAMGYTDGYLARVVLCQATALAVLGFGPGLAIAWWLHGLARAATHLPLAIGIERGALVLGLTVAMCSISGVFALRKLWVVDPAEIF